MKPGFDKTFVLDDVGMFEVFEKGDFGHDGLDVGGGGDIGKGDLFDCDCFACGPIQSSVDLAKSAFAERVP